jgi:hypothetical protein
MREILVIVILLSSICFTSSFAETVSNSVGSMTIDKSEFEVIRHFDELLKIYGTVEGSERGGKGHIQITFPDGTTDGSLFLISGNDYFESFFPIDYESQRGEYKILGTYEGQIIGTLTFSISEKIFTEEEIAEARGIESISEQEPEESISEQESSEPKVESELMIKAKAKAEAEAKAKAEAEAKAKAEAEAKAKAEAEAKAKAERS